MSYDYTHPEHYFDNLYWYQDTSSSDKEKRVSNYKKLGLRHPCLPDNSRGALLCRACGWDYTHEVASGYMPRVKIYHTRGSKGMWAIGSKWLLIDEPNDATLGPDRITQEFIRNHPDLDIPLPKVMQFLSEPDDQIHFTLMSRCQGQVLAELWHTLNPEQKAGYSRQMADIIKQMHRTTAPRAQMVDGRQMGDSFLGLCIRRHYPTCKKVGFTQEEWIEDLAPGVRKGIAKRLKTQDPDVIEAKFQELKNALPKDFAPYVLTHGDLHMWNIIAKDDKIEAIIDWELGGFMPWWVDRWQSMIANGGPEVEEFFDPVWEQVYPDMDRERFRTEVVLPLSEFRSMFEACPHDHIDFDSHYQRPPWCECKPYGGRLRALDIGRSMTHVITNGGGRGDSVPQTWRTMPYEFTYRGRNLFEEEEQSKR